MSERPEDFLSIRQTADLLNISRQGVHKLIKLGLLPATREVERYTWKVRRTDAYKRLHHAPKGTRGKAD